MGALAEFLWTMWSDRRRLVAMALGDLKLRYHGRLAGLLWSVLQPLAMIATFWFVFSFGFKIKSVGNTPFLLYFICGLAPWLFFTEALTQGVTAISSRSHLVKFVVFPVETLPAIPLITALVGHLAMLTLVFAILILGGHGVSWALVQLPFYTIALMIFACGLIWILSALQLFIPDVADVTNVVIGLWFWLTPIVWPVEFLPDALRPFASLNPMYFIVEGYRNSLLNGIPAWEQSGVAVLSFWAPTLLFLLAGAALFKRLKPEFSEVL